jgi:tubulin polyglutamylase TTLL11
VTKPKDIPLNSYTNANNMEYVVQPYIDNPLVLEKKKFDLRLYILISSLDPYICYLNEEGLARFCAEDYQPPNK